MLALKVMRLGNKGLNITVQDRARGALVGLAVGDAISSTLKRSSKKFNIWQK